MNFKFRITIFLGLLCYGNIFSQAQFQKQLPKDFPPLDSSIRYGQLANGFTYFIKPLDHPQTTLYLKLYNNIGSEQEDQDQVEMAHAVEHLAFKTTKNFPTGIYNDDRLPRLNIGMYDYGATSGSKSTKYYFDVPKGNAEALALGLLWFKDIVNGKLALSEAEIDQVRGELRQEFLLKIGDNLNSKYTISRLNALLYPCKKDYSIFFDHLETFDPEVLRRFYNDWYRPDQMAISIVGNIEDINKFENRIKNYFSDIPPSKVKRKPRNCAAEFYKRPLSFI